MTQSLYGFLPHVAVLLFLIVALAALLRKGGFANAWMIPALFSAVFALWTAHAIQTGGVFGFWAEHSRNAWSNQIWFDLLFGICMSWVLLLPRARSVGMTPLPWLVFILCTGGIGLLAMFARCLFLESRNLHVKGN